MMLQSPGQHLSTQSRSLLGDCGIEGGPMLPEQERRVPGAEETLVCMVHAWDSASKARLQGEETPALFLGLPGTQGFSGPSLEGTGCGSMSGVRQ